jgi:hypothetical protein
MNSSVLDQMTRIAAPELNFLLLEKPHVVADGGLDLGLFCREHAYCTALLGGLLGMPCQVVRGDILIVVPGRDRLSSIEDASDHAWCATTQVPVLDLSLSFQYFWMDPRTAGPICGLGMNGDFDVRILPSDTKQDAEVGSAPVVGYIPRRAIQRTPRALIAKPLSVLRNNTSADISAAVALHAYLLVSGDAEPIAGTMKQKPALDLLLERHSHPLDRLRALVAKLGL